MATDKQRRDDHVTPTKAHRLESKRLKQVAKGRKRAARRRERKLQEKEERDRLMTRLYGRRGHGSCGRKTRYKDEGSARVAARKLQRSATRHIYVYHCELCDGWHLTSHPKDGATS
jgi:hypothetical protein